MENNTAQLALAQLAILIFSAMVLFSQSGLMLWIAVLLGLALSFSLGAVLAITNNMHAENPSEFRHRHAAVLGTHIGGAICYMIMISIVFQKLS